MHSAESFPQFLQKNPIQSSRQAALRDEEIFEGGLSVHADIAFVIHPE